MSRGIETHNGIVIIPGALTAEEIAEAIWEHATRVLTDPDSYKADISGLPATIWEQVSRTLTDPDSYKADMSELLLEIQHGSAIFPENTGVFVVFTAGAGDNEWSDWAEIEDELGNKFSDEATARLHLSSVVIENTNVKDETYLIEIAYGEDKIPVTPYRFIAGETTKLPAVQQQRVRSYFVPAGEDIYYRMKCEAGGKTCDLHIRYHLHEV